jgi:hypothetical protein
VAVVDVNGDGRPDLVEINQDGAAAVLLNATPAGAPAFATAQTFAVGSSPISLVVSDLNGDGRPDLAVVNNGDNTVTVLLNATPAGANALAFAAPQTFAVNAPVSVTAGDLNGDGRPDLIVASSAGDAVTVLLNNTPAGAGTVTFAAPQTFAAGSAPLAVAVADFNGDGRPDLAVTDLNTNGVTVLVNATPAGAAVAAFAAPQMFTAGGFPTGLAVADVNGDGRFDLATANFNDGSASVLLNTTPAGAATVSFAAPQTFAVGTDPQAVVAADVNGDGRPDLAVANSVSETVSVLENVTAVGASTAAFTAQRTFAVGTLPTALAAGDVNGDGRPDLVVADNGDTTMTVLQNTTTPFASAAPGVAGQFGDQGVWEFNRALGTWVQLTPANATALAANPGGDVAAAFQGYGVWLYRPTTGWVQIGTGNASVLAMDAQGDVAGSFPGAGVWLYRPSAGFRKIGTADAIALAMDAQGDVAGSYTKAGVWLYRPSAGFQKIGTADASVLAMDAHGDVAGSFPGAGVWLYRPSAGFRKIGTADAIALAMDAQGDVVGSYTGHGVWLYRPAVGFQQIGLSDATALTIDALGDVFGAFAGAGVWEFNLYRGWSHRAASDAALLAVA